MALKVVKSAGHYTETAVDEIKLLKCVRHLPYCSSLLELPWAWQCGCRACWGPAEWGGATRGARLQLALPSKRTQESRGLKEAAGSLQVGLSWTGEGGQKCFRGYEQSSC